MLRAETVEEFVISYIDEGVFSIKENNAVSFNLHDNEGGASLTIDNNELFITICEPAMDIIIVTSITLLGKIVFESSKALLYPVNKSDSWESQPTISADGNTLLFTSIRPGGKEALIYSVSRTEMVLGDLQSLSFKP